MSGGPHLIRPEQRTADDGERGMQDIALQIHKSR